MRKRNRFISRVIPIAALGLLVLFKFENCAPAANFASAASTGGTVKIVDNWNASPVAFVNSAQVVKADPTVVQGLCVGNPDGTVVNWAITSTLNPTQILDSGQVECQNGEFEVAVTSLAFQSCTDQFEIRAASSVNTGQMATTFLEPDCPSVDQ